MGSTPKSDRRDALLRRHVRRGDRRIPQDQLTYRQTGLGDGESLAACGIVHMTPEQWQELQDLFEEVIQKPLPERPGVLERLESQIRDSAVRLELRRLVEHAEAGAEFLRPVAGLGIYPDLTELRPGDVIADRFE